MNVIFLDFDGVINSMDFESYKLAVNRLRLRVPTIGEFNAQNKYFSRLIITYLNLLGIFDCKIVVTSSWRYGRSIDNLNELLFSHGCILPVIGKTKEEDNQGVIDHREIRGDEIKEYLDKHPEITNFVVIDDVDDGISGLFPDNFIHTDGQYGFSGNNLLRAVRIFQKDRA